MSHEALDFQLSDELILEFLVLYRSFFDNFQSEYCSRGFVFDEEDVSKSSLS